MGNNTCIENTFYWKIKLFYTMQYFKYNLHNRLCFCLCAYDGIKWMNFDSTKFGIQHIIFLLQHGILLQQKMSVVE